MQAAFLQIKFIIVSLGLRTMFPLSVFLYNVTMFCFMHCVLLECWAMCCSNWLLMDEAFACLGARAPAGRVARFKEVFVVCHTMI